jgi:signal transduction histidine kinase/streptogramin lyase
MVGLRALSGLLCFMCVAWLGSAPCYALDPSSHLTQYAHTSWRVQDGVFRGPPSALAQSLDGYLWIGTLGGVYRYDGVTLALAAFSEGNQMRSPRVQSLLAARDGSLWIGTGSDLEHWSKDQLTHYPENLGFISGIAESPGGSIWFTRDLSGDLTGAMCHVEGEHSHCFGKSANVSIVSSGLYGLPHDDKGFLWFGNNLKIFRWDPKSARVVATIEIPNSGGEQGVSSMQVDSSGNLLIGSQQSGHRTGLVIHDGKTTLPLEAAGIDVANLSVTALLWDREGTLWIGTDNGGLYRVAHGKAERYHSTDGLSGESVNALFEDSEGNLWVATVGGLDRFRDLKVITYSSREGLSGDAANAVVARRDGSIWLSNFHSLDSIKDGAVSSVRAGAGLPGSQVSALFEDHANALWVGIDGGLFVYDGARFTEMLTAAGKKTGSIRSISEDRSGTLWAMSDGGRLYAFKNRKADREVTDGDAGFAITPAMAPDAKAGIWLVAKNQDFVHVTDAGISRVEFNRAPHSANVYSLIALDDGTVVAGSAVGVSASRGGRVQTFGMANGLPCPHVWSLIQATDSSLWLYTECGVVVIEQEEWDRWWADSSQRVQLKVVDALEGAQAANAFFTSTSARAADGRLWFVNSGVAQSIAPSVLRRPSAFAPIQIGQVVADQGVFSASAAVDLPAKPRSVQIDYTAPSFATPSKTRFRYRLIGHDPDWVDAGTRRQAFYTDLSPGQFKFEVMASNSDGQWADRSAVLAISVAPTFYQTKWFLAGCVVALSVIAWLLYLMRLRQLAARISMRIEARLAERERIARDLHDTLLQGVQGLLFSFHAGIQRISSSEPTRLMLEEALTRADGLISEGREQVMGLRREFSGTESLEDRLLALVSRYEPAAAAKVRISTEGQARPLQRAASEQLVRIAGEAIQNALTHAAARHIEVEISYGEAELVLSIRDDGVGFDPVFLKERPNPGHFGVLGMTERASAMGAELHILTGTVEGTRVRLSVPAERSYEPRQQPKIWARLSRLWSLPADLD